MPSSLLSTEPLLEENKKRYVLFPIEYQDVWEMQKLQIQSMWEVDKIDFSADNADWEKLNEKEKFYIKNILAFFAAADGIVMENISLNFGSEIQIAEIRHFYATQEHMEAVHSHTYSQLIDVYITDLDERNKIFNAIEHIPAIKKKAEWAKKWINSKERFAVRLVAFAIVEGIFFSGAFCSIYWLKERHLMEKTLCATNNYISRDEGLHCDFAILLYNKYVVNKLTQEELDEMVSEAVNIEKEFITHSLPCSLLGMNANLMSQYIEFVADRFIKQIGHKSIYDGIKNPFPFMDRICLQPIKNFFDMRVTEYKKDFGNTPKEINFDEDF